MNIRQIEDCIRATRKYKEYIGSMRYEHPIQGAGFPSEKFHKYYEVYPDMEISLDMPAADAIDWLWGDTIIINTEFTYDYRANKATFEVRNGALKELERSIPGFTDIVNKLRKATVAG